MPGEKELTEEERDELEDLLRGMVVERKTIREGMGFCIARSSSAVEIAQTLSEALTLDETPAPKKIARLFLLSDILHNALGAASQATASRSVAAGVVPRDANAYRAAFQRHLPNIFVSLHGCLSRLDSRMAIETMKEQVVKVLYVWQVGPARSGAALAPMAQPQPAPRQPSPRTTLPAPDGGCGIATCPSSSPTLPHTSLAHVLLNGMCTARWHARRGDFPDWRQARPAAHPNCRRRQSLLPPYSLLTFGWSLARVPPPRLPLSPLLTGVGSLPPLFPHQAGAHPAARLARPAETGWRRCTRRRRPRGRPRCPTRRLRIRFGFQ